MTAFRVPAFRAVTARSIRCSARRDGCSCPAPPRHLPVSSLRFLGRWAALLVASGLLAYGLDHAHFPAALLLGPMVAAIAFGVGGANLSVPKPGFQAAQAMIGCLVAHTVTGEIVGTITEDGLLILAVVLVTVLVGGGVGWILTRLRILPGTTAAWGSSPGGAAAMVAMSEEYGADPRLVAFMQYVRVVAVVLSASVMARLLTDVSQAAAAPVPAATPPSTMLATLAVAACGAALAKLLRLPAFALVGPMLLGAALHASGLVAMALPMPVLDLAYATIGWYVGLRFRRETLTETMSALPGILVATFGVIALCGGWAYGLTFLLPIDFLTAYLATSPGDSTRWRSSRSAPRSMSRSCWRCRPCGSSWCW